MAKTHSTGTYLSAAVAATAGLFLALEGPIGPWQPLTVMLGSAGLIALLGALVTGYPWGLGVATVLFVLDAGVASVAEAGGVDPALTVAALMLMIEAGVTSFDARVRPVPVLLCLVRGFALATISAFVVLLARLAVTGVPVAGPYLPVIGLLAAAFGVGLLLWLRRRRAET